MLEKYNYKIEQYWQCHFSDIATYLKIEKQVTVLKPALTVPEQEV
jgi:hypothetical protein